MTWVILNGGDYDGVRVDHPDVADPDSPPPTIDHEGITFELMDSWPRDVHGDVRYLAPVDVHESDEHAVRPHTT